jgi:hypothetical protein
MTAGGSVGDGLSGRDVRGATWRERRAVGEVDRADHVEAVPQVQGHVPGVRRLEVGGELVRVDDGERVGQQPGPDARAVQPRLDGDLAEVPVRLRRVLGAGGLVDHTEALQVTGAAHRGHGGEEAAGAVVGPRRRARRRPPGAGAREQVRGAERDERLLGEEAEERLELGCPSCGVEHPRHHGVVGEAGGEHATDLGRVGCGGGADVRHAGECARAIRSPLAPGTAPAHVSLRRRRR